MELEKSTLAEKKGIKNKQHGISFLMRDVADMITTLNRAVHGEEFDERTAQWVLEVGPQILGSINKKAEQA